MKSFLSWLRRTYKKKSFIKSTKIIGFFFAVGRPTDWPTDRPTAVGLVTLLRTLNQSSVQSDRLDSCRPVGRSPDIKTHGFAAE